MALEAFHAANQGLIQVLKVLELKGRVQVICCYDVEWKPQGYRWFIYYIDQPSGTTYHLADAEHLSTAVINATAQLGKIADELKGQGSGAARLGDSPLGNGNFRSTGRSLPEHGLREEAPGREDDGQD